LDTELNNSKNTQDTGGNDDLYFLEIIDKNKDNEKKIKFEYKNTDFEEGDMITSYIEHQIEKKLILKYPGGIPIEKSPHSKAKIQKNKLYELPENLKERMNKMK